MAEVKWIKITTNMFEDEKIDFIESLPEADAILVVWIKLLTLAGKNNSNGFIFLTEQIPYTTEMLSHRFRKPLNTVKLALETLRKLNMIEFDDEGFLKIANWEKHQNIDGLDKIREQTRKRVARHREKHLTDSNVTCNVTVTESNATEEELEEDIDIDIDKDKDKEIDKEIDNKQSTPYKKIVDLYNDICITLPKIIKTTDKRKKTIRARWKTYNNLDTYKELFSKAEESDFLSGRNGKWTNCNFDWLLNENNMIKVLEGNYKNSGGKNESRAKLTGDTPKRKEKSLNELIQEELERQGRAEL